MVQTKERNKHFIRGFTKKINYKLLPSKNRFTVTRDDPVVIYQPLIDLLYVDI